MSELEGEHDMIKSIFKSMSTVLTTPEEEIVSQGTKGDTMYFVQFGYCAPNMQFGNKGRKTALGVLSEGDYFGELSLIYKCFRTASVVSCNYNTLACLNFNSWRDCVNEFPALLKH